MRSILSVLLMSQNWLILSQAARKAAVVAASETIVSIMKWNYLLKGVANWPRTSDYKADTLSSQPPSFDKYPQAKIQISS